MFDRRQGAGFQEEALPGIRLVVEMGFEHLEGDRPEQGEVLGVEDVSHSALAEQPQHAVIAEPAEFFGTSRRAEEGVASHF